MKHLTEPERTVPVGAHVCTIRDRRLSNAVLVGLVGLAAMPLHVNIGQDRGSR